MSVFNNCVHVICNKSGDGNTVLRINWIQLSAFVENLRESGQSEGHVYLVLYLASCCAGVGGVHGVASVPSGSANSCGHS